MWRFMFTFIKVSTTWSPFYVLLVTSRIHIIDMCKETKLTGWRNSPFVFKEMYICLEFFFFFFLYTMASNHLLLDPKLYFLKEFYCLVVYCRIVALYTFPPDTQLISFLHIFKQCINLPIGSVYI